MNFFFYLLRLRRYKAKRVKTRSLQEWVCHFEPKFQGEGVVPGEYFLVSIKLDTFCYPTVHRATCRRFDTIPACDGRTHRRTDGIAVANTALAMRALRRAVKTKIRFKAILIAALKHVTMRLMSFWQRLSGSEVSPESGSPVHGRRRA